MSADISLAIQPLGESDVDQSAVRVQHSDALLAPSSPSSTPPGSPLQLRLGTSMGSGSKPQLRQQSQLRQILPKENAAALLARSLVGLCPSVAPTPRQACNSESVHPSERRLARLRPGQILLPSAGPTNDTARVRNSGRSTWLGRSTSEPTIASAFEVVGHGTISPKTPRTLRGVVRRVSSVTMTYPDVPSPVNEAATRRRPRSASFSSIPGGSQQKSPSAKRVSFATDLEKDVPEISEQLKRSRKLLASLYDLRRAKCVPGSSPEASVDLAPHADEVGNDLSNKMADSPSQVQVASEEASKDEIIDEPLLYSTLKDTEDTEAQLRLTETTMLAAHEPVAECGGSRHATAVVSGRTLAVIQRKAKLLELAEGRLAAFEREYGRRDEIRAEILASDVEPPPDLIRLDKFLKQHTHKDGHPEDANKSDFLSFCSSFGLPRGHAIQRRMLELGSEATMWWARAALAEAQNGTDTSGVHRLLELAAAILGNPEHEAIVECKTYLGNVLAENVLKSALKIQEKDSNLVESMSKPQPDSAKNAHEAINAEITTAVSMGAPNSHQSLIQAKKIATDFVGLEKDRLAMKVLKDAEATRDKDAAAAARCSGVPPVGPATKAAEKIEADIDAVIKGHAKVPETHHTLQEAKKVAKSLRDEDGQRKRMAAREKRLAEQKK